LHDVWPSPGLVHCILTEFCLVQNSLCVQVLRAAMIVLFFNVYVLPFGVINDDDDSLWAALLDGTRAVGVSQTLWRGIFTRQSGHPVRHWAVELPSFFKCYLLYKTSPVVASAERINTSVVSAGQPMSVRPPVTDSLSSWSSSWLNTSSDGSAQCDVGVIRWPCDIYQFLYVYFVYVLNAYFYLYIFLLRHVLHNRRIK